MSGKAASVQPVAIMGTMPSQQVPPVTSTASAFSFGTGMVSTSSHVAAAPKPGFAFQVPAAPSATPPPAAGSFSFGAPITTTSAASAQQKPQTLLFGALMPPAPSSTTAIAEVSAKPKTPPPPPPKPDYKAQASPVIDELVESLVAEEIRSIAQQLLNRFNACQRLAPGVASALIEDVISTQLQVVAKAAVRRSIHIEQSSNVLLKSVLQDVVDTIALQQAQDALAERHINIHRLRKYYRHWCARHQLHVEQRRRKSETERRYKESMRSMPLMMPSSLQQRLAFATSSSRAISVKQIASSMSINDSLRTV